jgi:hypothetical protein
VKWPASAVSYRDLVTSQEIILILAGVPLAILVLIGLWTMRSSFVRRRRYRVGDEWNYPAVLWMANPEALRNGMAAPHGRDGSRGARGGARGNW